MLQRWRRLRQSPRVNGFTDLVAVADDAVVAGVAAEGSAGAQPLDLQVGAVVREARAAIAARHPEIATLLSRVQTAVNRTVVGTEHALGEGDELALLPPVSGGSSL
jgi:molybdopterin synthase catalytic subunit